MKSCLLQLNERAVLSIQESDKLLFYVLIYLTVAGEGLASLLVPGQSPDKAGIFYLLIEIADKGTASHVATGDLVYWATFFFSSFWVEDGNDSCYSAGRENTFNCIVVLLRTDKGEQSTFLVDTLILYFSTSPNARLFN